MVYAVQAHVPRVVIASPAEPKLHKKCLRQHDRKAATARATCLNREEVVQRLATRIRKTIVSIALAGKARRNLISMSPYWYEPLSL